MITQARILLLFAALTASGALAQEARRQHGAHTHGEGRLAIAIEGARLEMELEVPASDIVGFEHAPGNAKQRKALADAKERLAKGGELFRPAAEAGCKLASAKVEVLGAAAGGKSHGHAGHAHGAAGKGKAEPEAHSEFKATYAFECATVARINSIAFDYFKTFERADKLAVTVVGAKGQTSAAVTRAKPVLTIPPGTV